MSRYRAGKNIHSRPHGWWQRLFHNELPLESETTVFILVNVLDFFTTFWMLTTRDHFHESNPIAAWFLQGWGPIKGLLYYKLSLVTVVCLISQIIATRRLETARWLLNFGTFVVSVVVAYSLALLLRHG